MSLRSWVRTVVARPVTRPIRRGSPRVRLGVEGLEDRWVPSTFPVLNNLDDGSVGSLRWAVVQANSTAGVDEIVFDSGVFSTLQTITLGGTQLALTDTAGATTITGPNKGVTVDGGGLSRVFQVDAMVSASISGLTISGGNAGYDYGGGLFTYFGTAILTNTIVAGNQFGDVSGALAAASTNNLIGGNPFLAPLGSYGGTGQTMALLPGSPAINAGTSGAGIPTTDQRGMSRDGGVDIGAFESQGFQFAVAPGSTPQTADIGTAFAHPLAVSVTANNPIEPVDGGGGISFVAHPAANGATAILSATSPAISGGQAAVTAVPINVLGSYTVAVTFPGSSASLSLTNAGAVFTKLVVNTTSDSLTPGAGLLSLREAITFNNYSPTGNAPITFDRTVFATPKTITLTGSQLELSNTSGPVSITGPRAGVTVSGGGLSRVLQVDALVTASVSGLTITGGNAGLYDSGGGVLNFGTLTLTSCTVSGNAAGPTGFSYYGGGNGGGVANFGTLGMTNCAVTGNSARAGYFAFGGASGGGLYNIGTATLTNCTVSGNSAGGSFFGGGGGGIANIGSFFAPGATLALTNCTISGNTAKSGGGLYNGATATLTNCAVRDNVASSYSGGGVLTGHLFNGTATTLLTGCTVSGNSSGLNGGGVANYAATTLTNCTVSGNTALSGGGLFGSSTPINSYQAGMLTLTQCTVSGNTALSGGGVFTQGGAVGFYDFYTGEWVVVGQDAFTYLTNCTVSGNIATGAGGGLATDGLGTTTAVNTAISGNTAGTGGGLFTGGFTFIDTTFTGTTSLTNCTVSGNTAAGAGGGLVNTALGTTTVTRTTVKDNSADAGGGIANEGTLTIASSNVSNNRATSKGGGVSTTGGSVTITDSAINANQVISSGLALGGGIACENSVLSLTDCTVNANEANVTTAQGGGIYALDSAVDVRNSTINGNKVNGSERGEGGGIYSYDCVLTLVGSNVKGNKATTAFDDVFDGP